MSTLGKSLKVVERERFFDDAFFREAWDDFERAMQSVLDKFDDTGLRVDAGSRTQCQDVYSKIRSNNIDEDLYASQAIQINEKDGKFQAVMDVKDFNPRELQVRAVDDRIVVEGSYQKVSEDGSSSSCKSFYREFALPAAADIDFVSTALSKDGILTIKAPKKEGCAVGDGVHPSGSSSSCNTSSSAQQSSSFSDSNSSFKSSSSRTVVQSNTENSGDGYDSLPKEMRDKLMFCDSGFGSTKTSTCSSPAPSEAGSESSRVSSTMEFDLSKKAPVRTEVAFNVSNPSQSSQPPTYQQQPSQQSKFQHPPSQQQLHQQSSSQYSQYQQQQQSPPQPQVYQQPQQQYPSTPQSQFQYQSPPQSPFQQPSQFQSPPPQSPFQSPPPQPPFQSPAPQSPFQSPAPQTQYQSPPPQTQYQSPPQSPFQKQQPQSQFQQQPLQSNFQPQPPPFVSPQGATEMFQQFSPFGGQGSQQSMAPAAPQPPKQPAPSVAVGSGKQSNINITEKNGRRVMTSQTSNVVQEKDGFMEHKETAAEIKDKDSQAARREASSKMSRVEEDPKGKFKRSESGDAAEVSESCVQHLPDGSVMTVKKNSSTTSSFQQSFSSSSDEPFFQPPSNFPSGFEDLRNLMGRGQNLMSQMSTDSMGSTLSGRSGFTDMSNFSHFNDTSSQFSDMPSFSNMSSFPTMGQMPSSRFNQQQTSQQQQQQQQQQFKTGPGGMGLQDFNSPGLSKSSNSFSSSSFSKSSFSSSFGDGNF
ncbi:hypothetical protein Pmani_035037 [Petrolisthes manimaculis]|uniref:SHSP domain-containing protein n=1 Tax=Petrolisthes manimaculis TaxID=1843537 RepID=A0AAE1TNT3_9EUCA|nr:hypothetical protein Pmani_035037 [Petrolisthes manimaculis]